MTATKVNIGLMGGLGNNLFQIACAYAYSLKNNKEIILFNEKIGIVHNGLGTYKDNILSKIEFSTKQDFNKFNTYNEPFFNYQEIPNIDSDVYLNGYFHSEKYFLEYEKEIRDLFSYPSNLVSDLVKKIFNLYEIDMNSDNTCSVHVRRGDYLKYPDQHPVQNMNYYMKAIRQMPKDSKFLIFSDDIAWCKQNFPDIPEKFKFIEGNLDYEDLLLMSMCKNNIICNSSFSWWGAWLNKNIDKKVIAPSKWFGPAYANHNTADLYCENWIKL